MKKILTVLLGFLSLHHAHVQAQDTSVSIAQLTLAGSIVGLWYDLKQARTNYRTYREKYMQKQLQLSPAKLPQQSINPQKQVITKPYSFSSFYFRKLVRGKQPISLVSMLTSAASIWYCVQQMANTQSAEEAMHEQSRKSNSTNPSGTMTMEQYVDTLPPEKTFTYTKKPTLAFTTKEALTQSGGTCALHAIFNAFLLARNAPDRDFKDTQLFERFKTKALELIHSESLCFYDGTTKLKSSATHKTGAGLNPAMVSALMANQEIRTLMGASASNKQIVLVTAHASSDKTRYAAGMELVSFHQDNFVVLLLAELPDYIGHATAINFYRAKPQDPYTITIANSLSSRNEFFTHIAHEIMSTILEAARGQDSGKITFVHRTQPQTTT